LKLLTLSGTGLLLSINSALAQDLGDLHIVKDARTRRVSSANPDVTSNFDFIRLRSGDTATICDVEGPGLITHIWFTYRTDDNYANRNVVLRAWWDDEETPSIEAPIGDFFGTGNGTYADIDSRPVQVAAGGRALNCFWPMPFGKRAKFTVSNEGPGYVDSFYFYLDYEQLAKASRPLATFHCQYRQEHPVVDGRDYVFAEIKGKGQYVGSVLSWWSVEEGWPGEGDDRFYIDGEEQPSLVGTGTEDYFSSSWGFREVSRGDYGVTVWDGTEPGSRCTAYRWHIHDPVRFTESLRATIEHRGWAIRDGKWDGHAHRDDRFSSAAFWYQTEPHVPFEALPPAAERLPYEEQAIELEASLDRVESGGTDTKPREQSGGQWSGNAQIFYPAVSQEEAWVKVPFEVAEAGRWIVVLRATASYDFGVWDILLDGERRMADRDMYSEDTKVDEISFGWLDLEAGEHTLEVRTVGKNPASTESGVYMGLDAIMLRR